MDDNFLQSESTQPQTSHSFQITESSNKTTLQLSKLVDELGRTDVIFLGEQHDNDSGHDFQLQVIRELAERGHSIVISMEQFERDVQGALNDYLAGRIDEGQFKHSSRPWRNYDKHYRSIIEFAKQNKIPVIASNVPRRIATAVSNGDVIAGTDKVLLPRETSAPENRYWDNFVATMKGHVGVDGSDKLKTFYAAQCLKDDGMAEAITDYLAVNDHQQKLVIHLCGHFHSDFGLGTAGRVLQRNPLLHIAVCTMETIPENGKLDSQVVHDRAHFVCWTTKNVSKNDETSPAELTEENKAEK